MHVKIIDPSFFIFTGTVPLFADGKQVQVLDRLMGEGKGCEG
jgi:hypothetical protein